MCESKCTWPSSHNIKRQYDTRTDTLSWLEARNSRDRSKLTHAEHEMTKHRKGNSLGKQIGNVVGSREPKDGSFTAGYSVTQELSRSEDMLHFHKCHRVKKQLGDIFVIRADRSRRGPRVSRIRNKSRKNSTSRAAKQAAKYSASVLDIETERWVFEN